MSEGLRVAERAAFDFVRYGNVWEDAEVLCKALAPRAKGGRLLSIASSGDNALALLSLNPKRVVAADLNPTQLACLGLRVAAFQGLKDSELLGFLGILEDSERLKKYDRLRKRLGHDARTWWDGKREVLEAGLIHQGKFESYLTAFGMKVLPLLQPGAWREALLQSKEPALQREIYARHWDHLLWRAFFRIFFSRPVMGRFGRDKAFLAQVHGLVGIRILKRSGYALSEIPAATNPYLHFITRGNFALEALPLYLRPKIRVQIRKRLDRLQLFQGPIQEAPGGPFDGFNLSDIFEYMSAKEHKAIYEALLKIARPKARLAYWNLLIERRCPVPEKARPLSDLAERLHAEDRAWFYQSFQLDEKK